MNTNPQIETYIENRDKSALYRGHMKREIDDNQLLEAILKIDDSVKPKRIDWIELLHDFLFPTVVKH